MSSTAYMVNLSSVQTVDITNGIENFTGLVDQYYPSNWLNACCTFLPHLTNKAWVYWQLQRNTVINPYKIGGLLTQEFLDEILDTSFSFLLRKDLDYSQQLKQELFDKKEAFLSLSSLKSIDGMTKRMVALALIEQAWNSIIEFNEKDIQKMGYLLETCGEDPIYLISNSNELNIHEGLRLLREKFPDIAWAVNIDISVQHNPSPIQLAPNIFLCVSYRYQAAKTSADNIAIYGMGTPDLMSKLYEDIKHRYQKIVAISQYEGDLKQAKLLGIKDIREANQFYPVEMVGQKLKKQ